MPELAEEVGASAIFFSKEVTQEEIDVEEALEKNAWAKGIQAKSFWQATLYHLEDLPFPVQQLPDMFTNFRKGVEKTAKIREMFPTPTRIPFPDSFVNNTDVPSIDELGLRMPKKESRSVLNFKGGEARALSRLDHYFWQSKALAEYKSTRNGLLGADFSSKFSPWLALGALSPRKIFWEVKKFENEIVKNSSTYWLIFELIWRDFFRFAAKKEGNRFFQLDGLLGKSKSWNRDKGLFQTWIDGKTGVPMVDANMRELKASGYMSNRGRQLVASFLVNDLEMDWRWGASYFESQLIDYDVCSNWGNWMYVAGVGHDPRADRYFHILNQSKKYDPQGEYVRHWVPELRNIKGFDAHQPFFISNGDKGTKAKSYPEPCMEVEKWK